MAHTNHMRYSKKVLNRESPQLSISMRDESSSTILKEAVKVGNRSRAQLQMGRVRFPQIEVRYAIIKFIMDEDIVTTYTERCSSLISGVGVAILCEDTGQP